MTWTGFTIDGNFYDLSHLQSSEHYVMVDGQEVKLHVSYSNHCFTDQKENGAMLFKKEQRYWCHERYARSKELPNLIQNNLIEHYAVPYLSKKFRVHAKSHRFQERLRAQFFVRHRKDPKVLRPPRSAQRRKALQLRAETRQFS